MNIRCPWCHSINHRLEALLGRLGRLSHYRCRYCGGDTRRISVHAINEDTAERMAWHALVGTRAWRPMWVVKAVLVDLANETCPECGWPLPPQLARCRGCNYPDPIPAGFSGRATLAQEETR